MEMSEVSPRAGNRWAVRAEAGREGRSRSTVWVETMTEWSARATWRAGEAGRLLLKGAWRERKWPVAAVSRMATLFGGEGPKLLE
jgi:hypothetical protein